MNSFACTLFRRIVFIAVLAVLSCENPATFAQVVDVKVGGSSLFQTYGGEVSVETSSYKGWLGGGWHDGPLAGFGLEFPLNGPTLDLGDETIPFSLPTDIFNPFVYFIGRGATLQRHSHNDSFLIFGGYSSDRFGTPFLLAATPEHPAGMVYFNHAIVPAVHYSADFVYSGRLAFLQSLQWKPKPLLALAATAGVSDRDPYSSASFDWQNSLLDLKASYTDTRDSFRRLTVSSPLNVEYDRENISLVVRPTRAFSFSLSRQNLLAPNTTEGNYAEEDGARAHVNGASVWFKLDGFRLHSSYYQSTFAQGVSHATMSGLERALTRRISVQADFLRFKTPTDPPRSSFSGTVREKLNAHWQLSQVIQIGYQQKTFGFGGSFESRRISAGVDYQTVYVPFYIPGQPALRQVALLHLRLLLPHDMELNADPSVTPLGQVRYTAYIDSLFYGDHSGGVRDSAGLNFKFSSCVVRGQVVDTQTNPISGVAIAVDDLLLFSDSDGMFFTRVSKCGAHRLSLRPQEFLFLERYAIEVLPETVVAAPEETAPEVRVVLSKLVPVP